MDKSIIFQTVQPIIWENTSNYHLLSYPLRSLLCKLPGITSEGVEICCAASQASIRGWKWEVIARMLIRLFVTLILVSLNSPPL